MLSSPARSHCSSASVSLAAEREWQELLVQPSPYLRLLLEQAPVAFSILRGPSFVLEIVNPLMASLWQHSVAHLVGEPLFAVLPALEPQGLRERLAEVLQTGTPYVAPAWQAPAAHSEDPCFFEFGYYPLRDEQDDVVALACVATDITAQVLARQQSEGHARQLQLLADAVPALIARIDHEERYVFANQTYEEWYGKRPAELLGRRVRDVIGDAAFERGQANRVRAQAGERVEFTDVIVTLAGVRRHVQGTLVPDMQHGQVLGYYILIADVTALVEAQRAAESSAQQAQALAQTLQDANRQLRRTNVDLDNFTYSAAHDLRTPITNIEGLLQELALEMPADLRQAGLVPRIMGLLQEEVERFRLTIAQLTDFTRLQQSQPPALETANLATIVENVRRDLAPQLAQTAARLHLNVTGCPQVALAPGHLRSIVYNLLSNALKYHSPDRVPQVHIRCEQQGDYTVLAVEDNGLGLDEEQRTALFGRFRRLHDHVEGSGIGLYVVKRSVENAGGRIEIDSQLGVGSTFRVYLPRY